MDGIDLGDLVPLGRDVLKFIDKYVYLLSALALAIAGFIAWGRKRK